ncbi:MAG: hypothetical protein Q8P67_12985 [archaeon]|nr:hypothetical protein [archaeon]
MIGTAELNGLWTKYCKDNSGRLDEKETVAFLQDFGVAVGSPIGKDAATEYFRSHCASAEGLAKEQFFALFVDVAREQPSGGRVELTSSLQSHGEEPVQEVQVSPLRPIPSTPELIEDILRKDRFEMMCDK